MTEVIMIRDFFGACALRGRRCGWPIASEPAFRHPLAADRRSVATICFVLMLSNSPNQTRELWLRSTE